ncbi:MAG: phage shock protein operon transcriptional activator, partial [Alphaproteobacteria bacterium]
MLAPTDLPPLLGESRPFLEVLEQVSRIAPLDRPVLVIGERGTGKELIASRLHFLSQRWDRPFVKLNCAALPESLLETELFGHEAGAFTGAARRRAGRFELADRGTLFLDEIAGATLSVQEKILRAVEYGEFERVGGDASLRVDVRVVGATNVDLPAVAEEGRFRQDLLDRLSFDVVTLPPLRARRDDVPVLTAHFGRAMAIELGWDGFPGFTDAATEALSDYPWPGNVRELKNVVERAVCRGEPGAPVGEVVFDPFGSPYRPAGPQGQGGEPAATAAPVSAGEPMVPDASYPMDLRETLAGIERGMLAAALAANRYNQRATADHLGLSYHQLRNSLRKHGLLG